MRVMPYSREVIAERQRWDRLLTAAINDYNRERRNRQRAERWGDHYKNQ